MVSVFDLFRLNGKTALVIGGARHLGYDIASALAEAGCAIALTSRTAASAESAATRLAENHSVKTLGLALDHRAPAAVNTTVMRIIEWRGSIDVLVNNAGGGSGAKPGAWLDRSPAEIE